MVPFISFHSRRARARAAVLHEPPVFVRGGGGAAAAAFFSSCTNKSERGERGEINCTAATFCFCVVQKAGKAAARRVLVQGGPVAKLQLNPLSEACVICTVIVSKK